MCSTYSNLPTALTNFSVKMVGDTTWDNFFPYDTVFIMNLLMTYMHILIFTSKFGEMKDVDQNEMSCLIYNFQTMAWVPIIFARALHIQDALALPLRQIDCSERCSIQWHSIKVMKYSTIMMCHLLSYMAQWNYFAIKTKHDENHPKIRIRSTYFAPNWKKS